MSKYVVPISIFWIGLCFLAGILVFSFSSANSAGTPSASSSKNGIALLRENGGGVADEVVKSKPTSGSIETTLCIDGGEIPCGEGTGVLTTSVQIKDK